jgi:hypothetical protein
VTTVTGDDVAGENSGSFAQDWEALRADEVIQFAPVQMPPREPPPQWWLDFLEFLGEVFGPLAGFFGSIARFLGMSGQVLMWLLIGLAVIVAGLLLWRYLPLLRRRAGETEAPEWTPDAGEASALLEDADRLAAEGRYGEATRLLLKRSVGQIAVARPGLLEPASTAREIAKLGALPESARSAFGTIAERVERSLFALRALDAGDWQAARAAYADFALAVPQNA